MLRPVSLDDAKKLVDIYNYYVSNTLISFEENELSEREMQSRIQQSEENENIWLVLETRESDGSLSIEGYAYCSPWKARAAYRFSYEVTIYLAPRVQGKGYGSILYNALFEEIKARPIKVLMASIALPNEASIGLHERMGMTKVAHFEKVGYKFDRWVDVGYWQLTLPEDPL